MNSVKARATTFFACGAFAAVPVVATVPPELLAKAPTIELSGVVWSKTLNRYLMVSDDVAIEGTTRKHVPWVFAMDSAGKLDADPIVIDGISDLNDPESICAGPDGTFFLTTSHSLNKKGHLPPSRRNLLHLALEGRRLRVIGRVDLTDARGPGGATLFETAKLPSGRPLDIEAVTYREGSLYIGLKSPLLDDGSATILRMAGAVAALKSGVVPEGAISVWARPRLCMPHDGHEVCEGVADMTFLPDGTALVVANSPKGMPSDGGGSLWRLPSASQPATFVHHFASLKPEGVTLSADGTAAVIVFDRDREPPQWVSWPLPK